MIGKYVLGKNPNGKKDVGYIYRRYDTGSYDVRWFVYGQNDEKEIPKDWKEIEGVTLSTGTKLESQSGMQSMIVETTPDSIIISRWGTSSSIDTIRFDKSKFMDIIRKAKRKIAEQYYSFDVKYLIDAMKDNNTYPLSLSHLIPDIKNIKEDLVIKKRNTDSLSMVIKKIIGNTAILISSTYENLDIDNINSNEQYAAIIISLETIKESFMLCKHRLIESSTIRSNLIRMNLNESLLSNITDHQWNKS